MSDESTWARRQSAALSGFVPIFALCVGGYTGGWVAESIGAPYPVGAVAGALVGFFASRSLLRWIFTRTLSEHTEETAG